MNPSEIVVLLYYKGKIKNTEYKMLYDFPKSLYPHKGENKFSMEKGY